MCLKSMVLRKVFRYAQLLCQRCSTLPSAPIHTIKSGGSRSRFWEKSIFIFWMAKLYTHMNFDFFHVLPLSMRKKVLPAPKTDCISRIQYFEHKKSFFKISRPLCDFFRSIIWCRKVHQSWHGKNDHVSFSWTLPSLCGTSYLGCKHTYSM